MESNPARPAYIRYGGAMTTLPGHYANDRLIDLIASGTKTATTSLLKHWNSEGQQPPQPGDREVVMDSRGLPRLIVDNTHTTIIPISDVTIEHVHAEGEGFTSKEHWRLAHEDIWGPCDDSEPVVCQTLSVRATINTPLIQAPMAGGVVTPNLVKAVCENGGIGMVPAGYLTPHALRDALPSTNLSYGINLFTPAPHLAEQPSPHDQQAYALYRNHLLAQGFDNLPEHPAYNDDYFEEKLDIAIASDAEWVTFTFGIPTPEAIARVHAAGKRVGLNAISPSGIDAALAAGVDLLTVQSASAGGHRAANAGLEKDTDSYTLPALTAYARRKDTSTVIAAAGGISRREDIPEGADAIQVGTRFLTATEASTHQQHRRILLDETPRETTTSRAWSGRMARGVITDFVENNAAVIEELVTALEHPSDLYPAVHYLTSPIRAQGDPRAMSLWAGTGHRHCAEQPASEIVAELSHQH